jgi:hypothetical protein
MRKTVAIASLAFGLSLAGLPAAASDGGHLSGWYDNACAEMLAQFDQGAAARQGDPRYNEALALRNQGAAECAYGNADSGSEKVRFALQEIGINPNY